MPHPAQCPIIRENSSRKTSATSHACRSGENFPIATSTMQNLLLTLFFSIKTRTFRCLPANSFRTDHEVTCGGIQERRWRNLSSNKVRFYFLQEQLEEIIKALRLLQEKVGNQKKKENNKEAPVWVLKLVHEKNKNQTNSRILEDSDSEPQP